jgi:hypothetical protein
MSVADLSSPSILTNVIAAPARAFAAINERPTAWLPLTILILAYTAVSVAYTSSVDLPWLIDQQLQQAQNLTDAQRQVAVENGSRMPVPVFAAIGAAGACIGIPLVFAVVALYYFAVAYAAGGGVRYRQWFALVAWCGLPMVFGRLAALVHVLSGDARFMRPEELSPFAFGVLLGADPATMTRVQGFLLSLDVTVVWSLVLSILGYQSFTKRSLAWSAAVVLAPTVLVFGVGALLALR